MSPRAMQIGALLRQGMGVSQIARSLGISSPAVSDHIARWPELRALRRRHAPTEHRQLTVLRQELVDIQKECRSIQRYVAHCIADLDDELSGIAVDIELGLRPRVN